MLWSCLWASAIFACPHDGRRTIHVSLRLSPHPPHQKAFELVDVVMNLTFTWHGHRSAIGRGVPGLILHSVNHSSHVVQNVSSHSLEFDMQELKGWSGRFRWWCNAPSPDLLQQEHMNDAKKRLQTSSTSTLQSTYYVRFGSFKRSRFQRRKSVRFMWSS